MRSSFLVSFSFATLLAAGCGSSPSGSGTVGNVVLHDANNYTSMGANGASTPSLTIPVVQTVAAMDIDICWSNLQKNLLCHDIVAGTATSIDNVGFAQIPHIMQTDVENRLATGKDVTNLVATYGQIKTTQTTGNCTMLSALMNQTSTASPTIVPATDYTENANTQYLLLFTHGTVEGAGAQGLVFVQPTASSTNTMVDAPDACSHNVLSFSATLGTSLPLAMSSPWKLDWSQLTHDSFGNTLDFAKTKVDKVEVGFYAGKTPADLQTNFFELDQPTFYTSLYTVSVPMGQKWIDLKGAKDASGAALDFSATGGGSGTWAVAVLCSTCSVPAPVALTVLDVTP